MAEITLIFPHQLFERQPALARGRPILLVEDSLFFGDRFNPLRFHKHKLLLHRASMAAYGESLRRRGFDVEFVRYDPARTARDLIADLARRGVRAVHLVDPEDYLLEKRLRESAGRLGIHLTIYPSPMFLTDVGWAQSVFAEAGRYLMADFYRAQRLRLNILVAGGRPVGGKWSFDAENRKALPRNHQPPAPRRFRYDASFTALASEIERDYPDHPGDTSTFWFPVTRQQALEALNEFLAERLALFGDYEDAISSRHAVVYHAVLTPALNIGLLTPSEVVERTIAFAETQAVPLNSLEGFIRQLIGWREFVRVLYRLEGVRMRRSNYWRHERPMPKSFYEGTTGLLPLDTVIRRVRERAWCHHIERLMVLSNAMLLCGIRPDDAYRWFMELFIDAYDWVMVPNLYGMGLFADGGLFATKPYISGSAYLRRMSDFPPGPWCEVWDALYWNFIGEHREFFAAHPRLSIMARQWERFSESRKEELRKCARRFLDALT